MSNVILDLSLNEPVFQKGFTFSDIGSGISEGPNRPISFNKNKRGLNTNTDILAIDRAIHNVFEWLPGDRILLPEFGNLIYKYLSELISDVTSKNIASSIAKMFEWDPRVKLLKINVDPRPDENEYRLQIIYEIPALSKQVETKFTINRVLRKIY